jgi:hypothetical protein
MGKGTIISGGTDGQYQVSVVYNTDRAQAEKAANLAKIANLEIQIAEETDDQKLNILKLQKLSLEKRNEILDNIPESETISAWCADLTEDLTGDVGLIEVPGEAVAFNIQPGHEDNAVYDSARDGQLFPTMAMTPAAAFYNLAMLPGWQKWKPTYRYGTITAISGDTADVTLDAATSTQQNLGVNQESTLTGVPVEYMSCNGAAFEVGDEVLVKFTSQDWGSPVVVGFKDNPVACEIPFYIRVKFNGSTPTLGGERIYFEYPNDPAGDYEKTYIVPADGLMGPYIHGTDPISHAIDGTKISLFWNRAQAPIRPIFHYFAASTSGEASHCTDIGYSTGNTGNNQLNIELKAMPDTGERYYEKVYRIRPAESIFDLPMTTETIGGVDYPVYAADFTVKMIRNKNNMPYTYLQNCTECSVVSGSTSLTDGYGYHESTDGDIAPGVDYQGVGGGFCEAGDPVGTGYGYNYEDFGTDLVSDSASLDSIVIITDEDGLSPSFSSFEYRYEYDYYYRLYDTDTGDTVCETTVTLSTEGGYEMVNSPDLYL